MNKNIRILQFLVSILYSVQSHFSGAQTIQLNGNGIPESITKSITGVDGNAALNISVPYKTSYTQNILSVESAKWHLNRSQFGIRIDHDLASISDHSLASQSITIWHASDH